jgi:rhodanese-related sulfurtransferase
LSDLRKTLAGAALIVVQAIALGFSANALSPHGLALIRKPLRQTHRLAGHREVFHAEPAGVPAAPALPAKPSLSQPVAKPEEAPPSKHAPEPPPPQKQPPAQPSPKPVKAQALFTNLPDAKALWDKKLATFVDARHKEDYDIEHIMGAVSLDALDFDALYAKVMGGVPKDRTIVTYCSDPQCETAIKLGDALAARGHTHVLILLEGLPGWKEAGYSTTKEASP